MPSSPKAEEEISKSHPPGEAMGKIPAKNSTSPKIGHRTTMPEQDASQRRTSRSAHAAAREPSRNNVNSQTISSTEKICSASSRPGRVAKTRQLRSKMVSCPLCDCEFLAGEIERHASLCLEANISHASKPFSGSRKKKRRSTSLSTSSHPPGSSNQISPSSDNIAKASSSTPDTMSVTLPVQSSKKKPKTQSFAGDTKVDTKRKKASKKIIPSNDVIEGEILGNHCPDGGEKQPPPKKKKISRKSEQSDEKATMTTSERTPPLKILNAASQKIQVKFPLGLQKKNGRPEWITSTGKELSISPLSKTLKAFAPVSEAKQFIEELHKCTTASVFFEILSLLKCARSGNLSVYQLMREVKILLGNKTYLLNSFNVFLPSWYHMENVVSSHEPYSVNEGSARTDKIVLWNSGSVKATVSVKDITDPNGDRIRGEKKGQDPEKTLPKLLPLKTEPSGRVKPFSQPPFPTATKHSHPVSTPQLFPQYASTAGIIQYPKGMPVVKPDTPHVKSRSPRGNFIVDREKYRPNSQARSHNFVKNSPEIILKQQQQHTGVHRQHEVPKYDYTLQKHIMHPPVLKASPISHTINNNMRRTGAHSAAPIQARQKYQSCVAYGSNALNKEKSSPKISYSNVHHKAPPNGGPTHSTICQQANQFSENVSVVKVRNSINSFPPVTNIHRQTSYFASDFKVAPKCANNGRSELQAIMLPADSYKGNPHPNVIKTPILADERMPSILPSISNKHHLNYVNDMQESNTRTNVEITHSAAKGAMHPRNNPALHNSTFSTQPVLATKPLHSVLKPLPRARPPTSSWNPILVNLSNPEDSKPYDGTKKPEKAKNAFTHFCRLMKPSLHKKFSQLVSEELKKKIQEETQLQWRRLSDAHKLEFVNRSVADHERFEHEMNVWKKIQGRRLMEGNVTKEELG